MTSKGFLNRMILSAFFVALSASAAKPVSNSYSSSSSSSNKGFFRRPPIYGFGSFQHEASGGFSVFNGAGSTLDLGKGGTAFELGGSYYKTFNDLMQIGGTANFVSYGGTTLLLMAAGTRFNFGDSMDSAIFVGPSIGFVKVGGGGFIFDVTGGKRFKLFPNVNYTPSAGIYLMKAGGGTLFRFRLDPVRFSVTF